MSYKEKPILKIYKYENSAFTLTALVDDYMECSFERNYYSAGQFTISINYNIPNASLFSRGLFIQFGSDAYDVGIITSIEDTISGEGKGSQLRTITGYDLRYLLKRRIIQNMNNEETWAMTAKGEICLRNLVYDQCGLGAESKRQLPIENTIPADADALGDTYSVSEAYSNLYDVCCTIATQSNIGWRIKFETTGMTLECYTGTDKSTTVFFDTSYESLADGTFIDSDESFCNAIYVGGQGNGSNRDIYEGEDGSPTGLDRYEAWDNQSSMTSVAEYQTEADSMLNQYAQTLELSGNGLAKCPYTYKEQYDVGDVVKVAFSGKSANVQIQSITEHWTFGNYDLNFSFGKPQKDLSQQIIAMLSEVQKYSATTDSQSTDSVMWYETPTDTAMQKSEVTYNTIGFTGTGGTFTMYWDSEGTGAKSYRVRVKNTTGAITLTTGVTGASNLTLPTGLYVYAITVDSDGNVTAQTTSYAVASDTANTATTATSATKVNIATSDSNTDYPLLFTSSVTAGNKSIFTDTDNRGSYNPSTNVMKIGGNVLGSNLPFIVQVYNGSTYTSGYFLLAQIEGTYSGNHDIGIIGSVIFGNTQISSRKTDFEIFIRGRAQTITWTVFTVNGKAPIIATCEAVDTNTFIARLYGQISANYQRFTTVINEAFIGDVYTRTSNRNVSFPGTYVTALTGTEITKTNLPTLIETSAPSSPSAGEIWIA